MHVNVDKIKVQFHKVIRYEKANVQQLLRQYFDFKHTKQVNDTSICTTKKHHTIYISINSYITVQQAQQHYNMGF